jgi:hypothetical protein
MRQRASVRSKKSCCSWTRIAPASLPCRHWYARRAPKLVIRVQVQAAYLHCGKALMRSDLWNTDRHVPRTILPSMGEMMKDQIGGDLPAETQEQMLLRYAQDL